MTFHAPVSAGRKFAPEKLATGGIGFMLAALLCAVIAPADPATQPASGSDNLIVNGDFETPEPADRNRVLVKDQLPGWKIERGDVDVVSTYWQAEHGNQSLDLNGLNPGIITQTVHTKPGQWYRLTFFYAGNPDERAADNTRVAEVQWGKKRLARLKPQLGTLAEMNWQPAEYILRATDAQSTLAFVAITDGAYGVAIDDVSLTACDPPAASATTRPAEAKESTAAPGVEK